MSINRRNGVVAMLIIISMSILIIGIGESRDLRPSEHGLPFQNFPAKSPEMMLFFGEQVSPPAKNSPAPESVGNSSETTSDTWWRGSPEKKEDRVRKALLVATVVCGGTGVALLLAAAVLFAVHFRRQRLGSSTNNPHQIQNSAPVTATTTMAIVSPNK